MATEEASRQLPGAVDAQSEIAPESVVSAPAVDEAPSVEQNLATEQEGQAEPDEPSGDSDLPTETQAIDEPAPAVTTVPVDASVPVATTAPIAPAATETVDESTEANEPAQPAANPEPTATPAPVVATQPTVTPDPIFTPAEPAGPVPSDDIVVEGPAVDESESATISDAGASACALTESAIEFLDVGDFARMDAALQRAAEFAGQAAEGEIASLASTLTAVGPSEDAAVAAIIATLNACAIHGYQV